MTHLLSPSTEAVLTTWPPRKSELAAPRPVFGLMWPSSDFSKISISLNTSKSEYFNLFFFLFCHIFGRAYRACVAKCAECSVRSVTWVVCLGVWCLHVCVGACGE